jgi:hypothetical protein
MDTAKYRESVKALKIHAADALKVIRRLPDELDPASDLARQGWSAGDNDTLNDLAGVILNLIQSSDEVHEAIGPAETDDDPEGE